ncbi:hypothetical protein [Paraburkholderia phytofirmans]|uniref:hypothetical protein n=1 Tax=Paraburkholderia phytofirmans TaxID=261302 RepID=UPI0003032EA5|nr:hypothetical protein [Paraburkholderia phytofirmans]
MNQKENELLVATLRFKPAAAPMTAEVNMTAEAVDFFAAASTGHAVWTSIPGAPVGDLLKRLGN